MKCNCSSTSLELLDLDPNGGYIADLIGSSCFMKDKTTKVKKSWLKTLGGMLHTINCEMWPFGLGCSIACLITLAMAGKKIEAIQQAFILYLLITSWPRRNA